MRRFPHESRRARRWTAARRFRGWLATWLQDRRRDRQQPPPETPNAPVLTGHDVSWDVTTPNWADIEVYFTFAHGTFSVANLEVWLSVNLGAYALLATIASTATSYAHTEACDLNGGTFDFKLRYQNGATLGPYSNVLRVDVAAI
jgi:hypothetical protein